MKNIALILTMVLALSAPLFADGDKPAEAKPAAAEAKPASTDTPAPAEFKAAYDEYIALGHLIDEETAALSALKNKQAELFTKLRGAMPTGKVYDPVKNAFVAAPEPSKDATPKPPEPSGK